MKNDEPFEIILEALMDKGYNEDDTVEIIESLIQDHKDMDEAAHKLHKAYEDELKDPSKWS